MFETYSHHRYYDPSAGRWLAKDPIRFNGGQTNFYVYVGNDPVNNIDPKGTDIWIEGPSSGFGVNEPGGHQSISVGTPNGNYVSYSWGLDTKSSLGMKFPTSFTGRVYKDFIHGGQIQSAILRTVPMQDLMAIQILEEDLKNGRSGIYGLTGNTCRSYSQNRYQYFKNLFGR
ncbi:MAG: RHS repeat-associated core domain-containing protein [Oligoflexales bacterium]|nr:RHS repeat-associated core domain-containing protein [Oligoflexales bacterium]